MYWQRTQKGQQMEKLMEETPAKVLSLLAIAMASLGVLMSVSLTNANLSGQMEYAFPNPPVSADKAMALLDRAASSYGSFVHETVTGPVKETLAFHVQSVQAAFDDATDSLALYMTVDSSAPQPAAVQVAPAPRVAGAYTERAPERSFGLLDAVLALVQ